MENSSGSRHSRRGSFAVFAAFAGLTLGGLWPGATVGLAQEPAPGTPSGDPQEEEPDWPGSFSLFGSMTRLAIGGYIELDVMHDTDAIESRCQFIPSTIATDGGTPSGGADGQTSFCVNATRLTLESRTPTSIGRLTTFFSIDLFDDELSDKPALRMRQAYGELEGAVWGGDLLLGQTWATYVDHDAWPDVLDFEGPSAAIGIRQPLLRWTKGVSADVAVQVAAEQPGGGTVAGADMLTRWPDFVAAVRWAIGAGHLRATGIGRDVRASADDNPAVSSFGWGVAGSGKLWLGSSNNVAFEVSYGRGTGSYYSDPLADGIIDPATAGLELLPLFAFYAAFEHAWSHSLSSTLLYSLTEADNLSAQPSGALRRIIYLSGNLIWRPDTPFTFGIEFLRGGRKDKGGADGTVNRIQLHSQLSF